MNNALIIFIKNPELGAVKTRLAATLGDEKALSIYKELLAHTRKVCVQVEVDRLLFYSKYIEEDAWRKSEFRKFVQEGDDLGERMKRAFRLAFEVLGYSNVVIIGSDCAELTAEVVADAFLQLEQHDMVIGPSNDGGYYLLGMRRMFEAVFEEKKWSTASVLKDTQADIHKANLTYHLLPELTDIDTEADWRKQVGT